METPKSKHPFYTSWRAMKQRCLNPKSDGYARYGGRGVRICSEWMNFSGFEKWAIQSNWAPGLTLDREDPNGNYEPGNCRWATALEQANNKRDDSKVNLIATVNGESMTIRKWAKKTGIHPVTLYKRFHSGIRGQDLIAPPNPLHRHTASGWIVRGKNLEAPRQDSASVPPFFLKKK